MRRKILAGVLALMLVAVSPFALATAYLAVFNSADGFEANVTGVKDHDTVEVRSEYYGERDVTLRGVDLKNCARGLAEQRLRNLVGEEVIVFHSYEGPLGLNLELKTNFKGEVVGDISNVDEDFDSVSERLSSLDDNC